MTEVRTPPFVAPPKDRLVWVDAARGLSVWAVVVFHVCLWFYLPLGDDVWPAADRIWSKVDSVLGGVRMPILLAVSGLVVARRVRAGLGDRTNLVRAASNYYLYAVWLVVYACFYAVVTERGLPHRVDGPLVALEQLAVPDTTLWYIFALAVYAVLFPAVRRVPAWVVLPVLVALTVVVRMVDTGGPLAWKVPELAVFFAIGVYGADLIRRFAESTTVVQAAAVIALAAGVTLCGRFMSSGVPASLLFVVRGTAFMLAAVAVIAVTARWKPMGRAAAALGRQTLSIYVMHPLFIALVIVGTSAMDPVTTAGILGNPVVAVLLPIVLATAIAVLCLLVHRVLVAGRLTLLFGLPARVRTAVLGRRGS